ncbi:hypothetical protein COL30_14860 [Bacillus pseudomycoides]|nr:hypothetical protein COO19_10445 [Bacillus pseudomycoides]PEI96464.1 hypothetical protein CN686_12245 [Bacillus pseudomycoides]PEK29290.1 hypothetical protein CN693_02900 [Bacillus pseudomycoides]PEM72363.1 hypothetical protein CN619_16375 [Bacillus pseudomycoides]PEO08766.1 hypothetical protein CN542_24960 [Bacillus pseudomycoides]
MHRSGQILFEPHAKLKQKEKASRGHLLFFIAMTYTLENQNRYSFLNSEEWKNSHSVVRNKGRGSICIKY